MPIGSMKWSPAFTAGQVASGLGFSTSMSGGRSGLLAAAQAEKR
jgi:hypothetical protein